MINQYPIANTIFRELDRFVNHALGAAAPLSCEDGKCCVEEAGGEDQDAEAKLGWKLRFELPGFKKDEVKLSIDEDFLNVIAETDDEARDFLGTVRRRVRISDEVDVDRIDAKLEDGILYLEIPRRVKAEPKSIVVN